MVPTQRCTSADAHEVLGIVPGASLADVRAAFECRALAVHPDAPGGSNAAFQQVLWAFEEASAAHLLIGHKQQLQEPVLNTQHDECHDLQSEAPRAELEALTPQGCGLIEDEAIAAEQHPRAVKRPLAAVDEARASAEEKELRTLHRLWSSLEQLPKQQRREVLAKSFTQEQRLALERWCLAGRPLPQKMAKAAQSRRRPAKGEKARRILAARKPKVSNLGKLPKDAPASLPGGIVPIYRHTKASHGKAYKYYLPGTVLNPPQEQDASIPRVTLRLFTRNCTTLEDAVRYHSVLVAIRQRTCPKSTDSASEHTSFEDRFRSAVARTLSEFDINAHEMGLKFTLSARCLWVSSPLRTPPYCFATQVEAGLQDWRSLDLARGHVKHRSYVVRRMGPEAILQSWANLRKEYLRIMVWFGRCECKLSRRLEDLQKQHESHLETQLQRWREARALAKERHRHHQAASSCRDLEQAGSCPDEADAAAGNMHLQTEHAKVAKLVQKPDESVLQHTILQLLRRWQKSLDKGCGQPQRSAGRRAVSEAGSKLSRPSRRGGA
mmetsp:Transcript_66383/g.158833  ORF Transcript_66383/g.158833 Transcript_66383/m.158833 type:complete len:552 (-) Transcript_66383:89-1744(-)